MDLIKYCKMRKHLCDIRRVHWITLKSKELKKNKINANGFH